MKAVVLENRDGYAAVLTEEGTVVKVRGTYEVGTTLAPDVLQTVLVTEQTKKTVRFPHARQIIAAAAALVMVVSGGLGYHTMTAQAYSYVTVDVNPSIEYTLNRLDKVIGVEAVNGNAEGIVSSLTMAGVKGKTLTEALSLTGELLRTEGYLSEAEDYLLFSIVPGDEGRRDRLEQEVTDAFGKAEAEDDILTITASSPADREAAREMNISTGRYAEIRRIEATRQGKAEEEIIPEENVVGQYRDRSVQELFRESGRIPEEAPAEGVQLPQGDEPEGTPHQSPPGTASPQGEAGDTPQGAPDGNTQPPQGEQPPQDTSEGGTQLPQGEQPPQGAPEGSAQPPQGAPDGNAQPPQGEQPPQGAPDGNVQPPQGELPSQSGQPPR